jgi:hypothetical protein
MITDARARRAVLFFLVLVTIIVLVRAASTAQGANDAAAAATRTPAPALTASANSRKLSWSIEEQGDILTAGAALSRTVTLFGLAGADDSLDLHWEALLGGAIVAQGRERAALLKGGTAQLTISFTPPAVEAPAGIELRARAVVRGVVEGEATFPFTVYPEGLGGPLANRLAQARVALYDPLDLARPALRALGINAEVAPAFEELALRQGDLIIIGPGGFARGQEALGPILAARARTGMPVLILDQPTLPGTLTEELRLWPSFSRTSATEEIFAPGHPVLRGLQAGRGASYFASQRGGARLLLPPTRGNFRVLAEVRARSGSAYQEGVALLEFPIGRGTVLAAQASLCSDYPGDARARILLANAIDYLLGDRPRLMRTFLYGRGVDDLPLCLTHLSLPAVTAPSDLEGVDLLLVPADWRASRHRAADLPPLARAARFLHEGGTVVLFNPQVMSLDYLRGVVGAPVSFEEPVGYADRAAVAARGALPMLQGIAPEDLDLLRVPGRPEIHLRARGGNDPIDPVLVAPGLARYTVGRGTLVALTLPDAGSCLSPRVSSLLARLLTNLGVPLESAPGTDPEAISRLEP